MALIQSVALTVKPKPTTSRREDKATSTGLGRVSQMSNRKICKGCLPRYLPCEVRIALHKENLHRGIGADRPEDKEEEGNEYHRARQVGDMGCRIAKDAHPEDTQHYGHNDVQEAVLGLTPSATTLGDVVADPVCKIATDEPSERRSRHYRQSGKAQVFELPTCGEQNGSCSLPLGTTHSGLDGREQDGPEHCRREETSQGVQKRTKAELPERGRVENAEMSPFCARTVSYKIEPWTSFTRVKVVHMFTS